MLSWFLFSGLMSLIIVQRRTYCWRWLASVIWEISISRIQLFSVMASFTDLFFFLGAMKISGVICCGVWSSSHFELQNRAVLPLPTVLVVAATKRSLSNWLHDSAVPTQGFSGATHSFQSHVSRSADANCCRSMTPRPPRSLGLQTLFQFTLHFPPEIFSPPPMRPCLNRICSIGLYRCILYRYMF